MAQTTFRGKFTHYLMMLLVATGMLAIPIISSSPAGASQAVSNFNASDGNQRAGTETINPTEVEDWETFLPNTTSDNLFFRQDTPSGTGDSSLAGGTKVDTECPTPSTGSVPDVKSDLKHFALAYELIEDTDQARDELFLYLEFVRGQPSNNTASASAIFELNQSDDPCPPVGKGGNTSPSPFVVRTPGDLRISINDQGGSEPVIKAQLWQEPCIGNKANDLSGCWLPEVQLSTEHTDASWNTQQIADLLLQDATGAPTAPQLNTQQFFEAKVNATDAGLIDPSSCLPFSAVWLQTGASGNSDKEQSKDIITPEMIDLDFCDPSTDITIDTAVKDENGDDIDVNSVPVGSTVTFTVTETNDGDVDLELPTAGDRDSLVSSPDCTLEHESGDTDADFVFDRGETWTFTCDVTLSSAGSFTFDVVGHGIDHLGRDVTWLITESTTDTDCGSSSVGDGGTLDTDVPADGTDDILCDADEADSLTLTVINPSTDLDLAIDTNDVTDIDTGSGVTWAAHRGDTIDFTIVEANDSNADLTIPGDTGDELDMIEVVVDFTPSDSSSTKTSDTCDNLTFDGDALADATGDPVPFDGTSTDPVHTDADSDGFADGDGDTVLDAGEAWLYSCSLTVSDEGGTATITATGHGIDPLGRDVTWLVTADDTDTDCASSSVGDGGTLDTDNDETDDVLCDNDEQDFESVEILAPSTVLNKFAEVTIVYTITEHNDGNVALSEPSGGWVQDDQCTTVDEVLGEDDDGDTPPSDATHNVGDHDNDDLLDPGETFVFTCTVTLDGPTTTGSTYGSTSKTNSATGDGVDPTGAHVTSTSQCDGASDGDVVVDDNDTPSDDSDDTTYVCDSDEADDTTVTVENNQSNKPSSS